MEKKELYQKIEEILSDYRTGLFTDAFYITELVELFYRLNEQPEEKIEIPEAYRKAFLNEDTPEEWEDTIEFNIMDFLEIECTDCGNEEGFGFNTDPLVVYIKQLLEERELEVWKEALSKLKDK